MNNNFDTQDISDTAKPNAYWLGMTDIPYAKEMSKKMNAERFMKQFNQNLLNALTRLKVPYIEAIYKIIDYELANQKTDRVLEIAMGYSTRSLYFAGEYIGTDLRETLETSVPLLKSCVDKDFFVERNPEYLECDILSKKDVDNVKTKIWKCNYAIINSGLMMYLTLDQKKIMADNIYELIKDSEAIWLTTDILINSDDFLKRLPLQYQQIIEFGYDLFKSISGIELRDGYFKTKQEAIEFYEQCGFSIKYISFRIIMPYLSSIKSLSKEEINLLEKFFDTKELWILKPRK